MREVPNLCFCLEYLKQAGLRLKRGPAQIWNLRVPVFVAFF